MKTCDLCYGINFVTLLDMGMQPIPENDNGCFYPLIVQECQDCGLVQLSESPPRDEVFPKGHPYASGNSKERKRHFTTLAEVIAIRMLFTQAGDDGLVVDIGANDGTLLKAVKKANSKLHLLGVEPTDQARKIEEADIRVLQKFFTENLGRQIARDGRASVVNASNVLAHVPDPHDFLDGVAALLTDDGVFITENHDWNAVAFGLQIDTIYHEHLRYFTVATLTELLRGHGLTVVDVERIQAHGGSFRVTAMKEPAPGDLTVAAEETAVRLRRRLVNSAGPIYGIGATTRATPLIHYAKLQEELTAVCEVSSSEKIGSDIPGTDIPIVDEEILFGEDQPPTAVLFSWHLADDIVPALRKKGYKGDIILPLPVPRDAEGNNG